MNGYSSKEPDYSEEKSPGKTQSRDKMLKEVKKFFPNSKDKITILTMAAREGICVEVFRKFYKNAKISNVERDPDIIRYNSNYGPKVDRQFFRDLERVLAFEHKYDVINADLIGHFCKSVEKTLKYLNKYEGAKILFLNLNNHKKFRFSRTQVSQDIVERFKDKEDSVLEAIKYLAPKYDVVVDHVYHRVHGIEVNGKYPKKKSFKEGQRVKPRRVFRLTLKKLKPLKKKVEVVKNGWYKEDNVKVHYVNDKIHHDTEPAKVYDYGRKEWYKNGSLHRDGDLPAVVDRKFERWYKNGRWHRDGDKPSHISCSGLLMWSKEGHSHRVGKPAIINEDGSEEFWEHGLPIGE